MIEQRPRPSDDALVAARSLTRDQRRTLAARLGAHGGSTAHVRQRRAARKGRGVAQAQAHLTDTDAKFDLATEVRELRGEDRPRVTADGQPKSLDERKRVAARMEALATQQREQVARDLAARPKVERVRREVQCDLARHAPTPSSPTVSSKAAKAVAARVNDAGAAAMVADKSVPCTAAGRLRDGRRAPSAAQEPAYRTVSSAADGAHDGLIPCGCRCRQMADYALSQVLVDDARARPPGASSAEGGQ